MLIGARTAAWAKTGGALPYAYQVEYIQSSGTQYIDTGIAPNANMRVVVDFYTLLTSGSTSAGLFGSRTGAAGQNNRLLVLQYMNGSHQTLRYDFGARAINLARVSFDIPLYHGESSYDASSGKAEFVLNGSAYSQIQSYADLDFSTNYAIYLFALNQANVAGMFHPSLRMKRYTLIENDTTIQDLIPVVDNSSVACMYDEVTGAFFYNQGTGSFIAGPVIS